MSDYTIDELISVCIARQVRDGDLLAQGINTPLVLAGLILAQCTHAPGARFVSAIGQGICRDWAPPGIARAEAMWLDRAQVNVGFAVAAADVLPRFHPKEFFRPAQVDAAGNFNNVALKRPALRLPGSGGIPDVTTYSESVHLYVPRHSRAVFVPGVDYVSGLGHTPERTHGKGPVYCISDLGQFDWAHGRMRLVSFHAGESVESVQKKTGFPLEVVPGVEQTPPPSAEEVRLLRDVIDPLNVRKLETLGGAARKALLREILEKEGV